MTLWLLDPEALNTFSLKVDQYSIALSCCDTSLRLNFVLTISIHKFQVSVGIEVKCGSECV